jgi:hypothetical protein
MSKHVFMMPIEAGCLVFKEIEPKGEYVIYSKIKQGVMEVYEEKAETMIDGVKLRFSGHFIHVQLAGLIIATLEKN